MKLGRFELKHGLILPPIAGYSDVGMRMLCIRYGAELTFTEMVSAKGLVYGNENTRELLITHETEKIKAVQLFGREEGFIARAVQLEPLKKFDIIDINFGCPVHKIVKSGEGSALMKEPEQVYKIIKYAVEAAEGRLVTGKIRAGWSKDFRNAVEVALAIQEGGGAMVTVHGRTRDMLYSGFADPGIIKEVKDSLKIPVVANGDIADRESYLRMLSATGADGVAIGRGAIGRPYVFSEVLGKTVEYDIGELLREHIEELLKYYPERVVVNNIKKHAAFYVKGRKGAKQIKESVLRAATVKEVLDSFAV
ncbi:MAG: tRNA dihydrouridine synthase DusB [Clostridiales bacterium]|jgi:tRNA-dihydrouridine synthase B|nr:tRNA dihydrouridine synthase DusB [Clostridiales bacterium]HOB64086.1 tRNA-dihydrouridine synthase [Clostridia bacterium]HOK81760.1 tRNA-dihydrouridine synthase [Clostridia bacterium]HOL60790.1 tRNA-dihydrouridine synthase [Clostridia bacterium]HPO53486.1 tRNA-dihydrouridine synthase [Clostridia bacterium]